ncbi:MAG: 2-oxo acid dehydrogenase subunit E2 [Myxococcota bacterium]|nr:2-oxo acid dehydrogenase subunit E2 [Myxococcota bacterium]MEE2780553.1 2-oxo acid dehydrogenase subunit E2 [Myxococcota bacterium]
MANIDYVGPARESSFRRMALAAWNRPSDPSIYGFLDVDMTPGLARIEELRAEGVRITVTHLIARAFAIAIGRLPDVNVLPRGGRAWQRSSVDVFLQVALPSEDSLGETDLSGVKIREADKKDLKVFAEEMAERVARVREGRDKAMKASKESINRIPRFILPRFLRFLEWLQVRLNIDLRWMGVARDPFGSVLVTSVGMLGIDAGLAPLFPVSGPPMVITVGAVQKQAVVDEDDQVVVRPMLRLGGTFDHRVLDGYHLAMIVKELRSLLSDEIHVL